MINLKNAVFKNLNISENNKTILCIDGGGVRGILTLQLLKLLEKTAKAPCYEIFDMVSGTSTGGIIASLIALGKTAKEIEKLYISLSEKVFTKRSLLSNRFTNPPEYSKTNYRKFVKKIFGEMTLSELATKTNTDILITARDVESAEETFFSCFNFEKNHGTYKNSKVKHIVEATMSAPTYFHPFEIFIDGGVTAYNNPTTAALIEAVKYCPNDKYLCENITIFSFGTGIQRIFVNKKEAKNPEGLDSLFWLKWLMNETADDVSDLQTYLLRTNKLFPKLDFRRFQISLHTDIIKKLPNLKIQKSKNFTEEKTLHQLTETDLKNLNLDSIEKIPILKTIGIGMGKFIEKKYNKKQLPPFGSDFVNNYGKDYLILRKGNIKEINSLLNN